MTANTLPGPALSLGGFLRDRRARLLPEPNVQGRRRTPGLRREEVATRAGVSVTWYTWLEQGRGGAPSDDVLERLARALQLDSTAREVLFLLAQQRPPPTHPENAPPVPTAVQRVLDSMPTCPAFMKTPLWDIVAWNAAALAVLGNFAILPTSARNSLRRIFGDPELRETLPDWEQNARFILSVFRVDLARAGEWPEAVALVAELQASSADFRRLWLETDVRSYAPGRKRLQHPVLGTLIFDYASFAVEGADGLGVVVFAPASRADGERITAFIETTREPA